MQRDSRSFTAEVSSADGRSVWFRMPAGALFCCNPSQEWVDVAFAPRALKRDRKSGEGGHDPGDGPGGSSRSLSPTMVIVWLIFEGCAMSGLLFWEVASDYHRDRGDRVHRC